MKDENVKEIVERNSKKGTDLGVVSEISQTACFRVLSGRLHFQKISLGAAASGSLIT